MADMEIFLQWTGLQGPLYSSSTVLASWEWVLIGSVVVSWAALLLAMVAIRRVHKQSSSLRQLIAQLNHDVLISSNGAVGMGRRIIKLERKLVGYSSSSSLPSAPADNSTVSAPQGIPPTRTSLRVPTGGDRDGLPTFGKNKVKKNGSMRPSLAAVDGVPVAEASFDLAEKLFRQGMDAEEVANRCGLSKSEADLMALVQRQRVSINA